MKLDNGNIKKLGLIAVWGCGGKMGTHYIDKLIQLGFPANQIAGVEINPDNLEKIRITFPGILITADAEKILEKKPNIAIVAVNSVAHLKVIELLMNAGVRKIFVEKPLVYYDHELTVLNRYDNRWLYTSYLINFSGIVEKLIKFMKEKRLVVMHSNSIWGKNWLAEKRAMGGDLEEETPHPLGVVTAVTSSCQKILSVDVLADFSSLQHVRDEYLEDARHINCAFPDSMNDATSASFTFYTDFGRIKAFMLTSFNFFEQVRRIEFCLGEKFAKAGVSKYKALLQFDLNSQTYDGAHQGNFDRLIVKNAETEEVIITEEYRSDKLKEQLEKVLLAYAEEEHDPRLVNYDQAKWQVSLLQKAIN